MTTFDDETGLHDRIPTDHELVRRMELLPQLGLSEDRSIPHFDALAETLSKEAAELVGQPAGFFAMVNIMKEDYQWFAGIYVPSGHGGESQATASGTASADRFMPRTAGWCVHTLDRRKALPLHDVFDYPRWLPGNEAVTMLGARTYLGTPLIHEPTGTTLGTCCLVGQEATQWGRQGVSLIKHFATQALAHIDELSHHVAH
ncbi:GAF domain-containing protein [Streptomyces sp. NPDC050704]|uniref:GAF domain-containing protein n=1 Tax=Streptomyces sp. NPDC050704 TaxID=3157219 RepID=UPI0034286CF1